MSNPLGATGFKRRAGLPQEQDTEATQKNNGPENDRGLSAPLPVPPFSVVHWHKRCSRSRSAACRGLLGGRSTDTTTMARHDTTAADLHHNPRAVQGYNYTLLSQPYSTGSPPTPGRGGTGSDVVTYSEECNLVRTRVPPWRGGVTTCTVRAEVGAAS